MEDRVSSTSDDVFHAVSQDLLDLMAYFKMTAETRHVLRRCDPEDAVLVDGSKLKLRLEILAINDLLEHALHGDPPDKPSKPFERLLERLDSLRKSHESTEESLFKEAWPEMRIKLVRQAALACIRAQQRKHTGPDPFDWGTVSTSEYIATVNRLIPTVDSDMDALNDEDEITAAKESRNLKDIFLEKRGGVHGSRVLALLRENKLATFEKDIKAFTKDVEAALLPIPKILKLYQNSGLLNENRNVTDEDDGQDSADAPSERRVSAAKPPWSSPRRKRGTRDVPGSAAALAKASEVLQREMKGRPGTVAEALAIGESVPEPRSPARKRLSARDQDESGARDGKTLAKYILGHVSQVSFDDSQSIDEPPAKRRTLQDRPTPPKGPGLRAPVRANAKKGERSRVPWTEEEVMHLNAAVKTLGKGNWALALTQYRFQDCRTSVDLKDKWRNLNKK